CEDDREGAAATMTVGLLRTSRVKVRRGASRAAGGPRRAARCRGGGRLPGRRRASTHEGARPAGVTVPGAGRSLERLPEDCAPPPWWWRPIPRQDPGQPIRPRRRPRTRGERPAFTTPVPESGRGFFGARDPSAATSRRGSVHGGAEQGPYSVPPGSAGPLPRVGREPVRR